MNEIHTIYRQISADCTTHLEVQDRMIKDYGYTWKEINKARVAMQANEPNYWFDKATSEMTAQLNAALEKNPLEHQIGGGHYEDMRIQPVEYITFNNMTFLEGCIVKYISRWRNKDGILDLQKIKHCVDLIINLENLHDRDTTGE